MNTVLTTLAGSPLPPRRSKEDPFRLGWRYVQKVSANGQVLGTEIVPLTDEDVLHPQEGDFIVNTDWHHEICRYLHTVLQARYPDRKKVLVLGDVRVAWDVPQGWAHGPDVGVFFNLKRKFSRSKGTFHVKRMGARAGMIMEATSPTTRDKDFGPKRREYFIVGVPYYIIIDIPESEQLGPIKLIGYKAGATQYEPLPLDNKGRLWLEPLGLWLVVEGPVVYLEEPSGERIPGYEKLMEQAKKAQDEAKKAQDMAKKAQDKARKARAQAEKALAKAQVESEARLRAEARVRELEAQLKRLQGR